MTFGGRLLAALDKRGPLCVGIDPHASLLQAWGLADDANGLASFAGAAADALAGDIAVLKPQSAFFERHGSAGVAVLERLISDARSAGAIVIVDAKRGDIGSTAAAYADAYLSSTSALAADAVTASPYLGYGSLRPMIDMATPNDRGVFVLALTSNPEGAQVQRAINADGRTVAQSIIDDAARDNAGAAPLGSVGLVIGATVGELGVDVRDLNGPVLVPGLGAQGGTPADLRRLFGDSPGVFGSASRSVLRAGPSVTGLRDAALRQLDEIVGG
jgi:orotidine-5'-phosphate decarboxylase